MPTVSPLGALIKVKETGLICMADRAHTTLHGAGLSQDWRTMIDRASDDEEGEKGREEIHDYLQ